MKKLITVLLFFLLISGCGSAEKIETTQEKVTDYTYVVEDTDRAIYLAGDSIIETVTKNGEETVRLLSESGDWTGFYEISKYDFAKDETLETAISYISQSYKGVDYLLEENSAFIVYNAVYDNENYIVVCDLYLNDKGYTKVLYYALAEEVMVPNSCYYIYLPQKAYCDDFGKYHFENCVAELEGVFNNIYLEYEALGLRYDSLDGYITDIYNSLGVDDFAEDRDVNGIWTIYQENKTVFLHSYSYNDGYNIVSIKCETGNAKSLVGFDCLVHSLHKDKDKTVSNNEEEDSGEYEPSLGKIANDKTPIYLESSDSMNGRSGYTTDYKLLSEDEYIRLGYYIKNSYLFYSSEEMVNILYGENEDGRIYREDGTLEYIVFVLDNGNYDHLAIWQFSDGSTSRSYNLEGLRDYVLDPEVDTIFGELDSSRTPTYYVSDTSGNFTAGWSTKYGIVSKKDLVLYSLNIDDVRADPEKYNFDYSPEMALELYFDGNDEGAVYRDDGTIAALVYYNFDNGQSSPDYIKMLFDNNGNSCGSTIYIHD